MYPFWPSILWQDLTDIPVMALIWSVGLDEAVTLNQKLQKDIDARDITISTLRRTLEEHSQMFSRMLPVIRELYSFGDMITI